MPTNVTFNQILNKFYLNVLLVLFLLIFQSIELKAQSPLLRGPITDIIEVSLNPQIPRLGDTVSIKIKKIDKENSFPKIYFEKSKLPVFQLSNQWFRTLIPISANYKTGLYPIEIFYNKSTKKITLEIKDKKYPLQELTLSKETAALKASRIEKSLVAKALSTVTREKLWNGKFIYPNNGKHSTPYGVKRKVNGIIYHDYFHKGLDFASAEGSLIIAPENGKIILAGYLSKGFVVNGNCIFIDHGHGVITGYLHLSKVLIKEGDVVKKGQIIGKVGSTGIASGPHLHWGVYVLGKTVDPINWTSTVIE